MKVDTFFLGLLELLSHEKYVIDWVDFEINNKIVIHTENELKIEKTMADLFHSYKDVLLWKITLLTFYKKKSVAQ